MQVGVPPWHLTNATLEISHWSNMYCKTSTHQIALRKKPVSTGTLEALDDLPGGSNENLKERWSPCRWYLSFLAFLGMYQLVHTKVNFQIVVIKHLRNSIITGPAVNWHSMTGLDMGMSFTSVLILEEYFAVRCHLVLSTKFGRDSSIPSPPYMRMDICTACGIHGRNATRRAHNDVFKHQCFLARCRITQCKMMMSGCV